MIYLMGLLLGIYAVDGNPYVKRMKAIQQVEAFSFCTCLCYKLYWIVSKMQHGKYEKIRGCFVILILNDNPTPWDSKYISVHIGKSNDLNKTVTSKFLAKDTENSIEDKYHKNTLIKYIPCSPHQVDPIITYLQELYKDYAVVL